MKLGDIPELQRLRSNDPKICPKCGGRKNPRYDLCSNCASGESSRSEGGSSRPPAGQRLPDEFVFSTFYNERGKLKDSLFYEKAQGLAELFHGEGLKSTPFRHLYQGFLAFAVPLRDKRMDFDSARERFGIFYVERVVRQTQRGYLPHVVKDFFDRHRDLALSSHEEMLGLFRYLTNVLCYFDKGDKEERAR